MSRLLLSLRACPQTKHPLDPAPRTSIDRARRPAIQDRRSPSGRQAICRSSIVQNLTKGPRIELLVRAGIQGIRRRAPGYPPPEFRGHTQRAARPVPAGRSRRQMTSPGGCSRQPQRPSRAVFRHDRACTTAPSWPRPRTASGRRDAAPHDPRSSPAPRGPGPAGGTQRMLCQERGAGPAPAGTIAATRRARALPVQLRLDYRRTPRPWWTVHGRLRGQRQLRKAKPAAAMPGGADLPIGGERLPPAPRLSLATSSTIAPICSPV